jgi:hypothetical protein
MGISVRPDWQVTKALIHTAQYLVTKLERSPRTMQMARCKNSQGLKRAIIYDFPRARQMLMQARLKQTHTEKDASGPFAFIYSTLIKCSRLGSEKEKRGVHSKICLRQWLLFRSARTFVGCASKLLLMCDVGRPFLCRCFIYTHTSLDVCV